MPDRRDGSSCPAFTVSEEEYLRDKEEKTEAWDEDERL